MHTAKVRSSEECCRECGIDILAAFGSIDCKRLQAVSVMHVDLRTRYLEQLCRHKRLQTFANETGLDSRFTIQDFKKVLESRGLGFKIQDLKKVLESRGLDSITFF